MVRKQFLLTSEQNARLKAHAAASGLTEIVRAGLDMALQQAKTAAEAWKAAWSAAAGLVGSR